MPNAAYTLIASPPTFDVDGHWWWILRSATEHRHGPFSTEADALSHREERFRRLRIRAQAKGGWGWRSTHTQWHVVLPEDVPCDAPRMERAACSQHLPLPNAAK